MKHILLKWAITTLLAGNAADNASSWGQHEVNPIMGVGRYATNQTAIKFGVTGLAIGVQLWLIKHHPQTEQEIVVEDFVVGGAMAGLATRNFLIQKSAGKP